MIHHPGGGPGLDARVLHAIENNVRWCDTVCRSHGAPGRVHAGWWATPHVVPRFHSNLITMADARCESEQRAAIKSLIDAEVPAAFSIKDSFACLDLSDLGFEALFEARWIWRPSQASGPDGEDPIRWSVVEGARELAEWEAAFSDHDANSPSDGLPRLFLPTLLAERGVAFLAGRSEEQIVAVAIANRSGEVVGLSNVFARRSAAAPHWPGCVRTVQGLFPGLTMVGYERGDDLAAAKAEGFEPIGPLTVWLRDEGAQGDR